MIGRMTFEQQRDPDAIEKDIRKQFTMFIERFYIERPRQSQNKRQNIKPEMQRWYKYREAAMEIKGQQRTSNYNLSVIYIETEHLVTYNLDLANTIFDEYYKYEKVLNEAFTQYMQQLIRESGDEVEELREQDKERFFVSFSSGLGGTNDDEVGIRDLKSFKVGKLTSLIGTVTRSTQIRPELIIGVFKCKNCHSFSKPVEQQFKYVEPKKCLNQNCDSKYWQLEQSLSEFADFQQLRVQQDPNSIPPGGMPRSLNVILRNNNTEKAQPGDMCKFVGYLCVAPDIISMLRPGQRTTLSTRNAETRGNAMEMDGVKGITGVRELNYKFMFIANNVYVRNRQYHQAETHVLDEEEEDELKQLLENQKRSFSSDMIYEKMFKNLTHSEMEQIKQMRSNPRLYQDLSDSLFPGIYGHSQIKKAILLQLFGGVHKTTAKNKISIRGDINVLLVGDPSTAKSQFLKTVNKFVPRSVYTNGKTTSAAGLTASVVRDDQGNVGIEAGALMLADNGVCCIDEFQKMNLSDMTAIHEAMEQQTISIAKAGVHATLNARTSVLAAANPTFGRYDKAKNLQQNINISPPIMSRFDMCFVICDDSNQAADSELCQFMIRMHRQRDNGIIKKYNNKSIRFYMGIAKKLRPMLTQEAGMKLRQCYSKIRKSVQATGASYAATVRQLQSMIRLSEAIARLNLNLMVLEQYVDEAYRLIMNSITRLKKPDVTIEQEEPELKENKGSVHNIIQQEMRKKKTEKKDKKISLSSEVYNDICSSVLKIFQEQQKLRQNSSMDSQDDIKITQGNIINYVVSLEVEKGTIESEEQNNNYRKIVKGVIKKMIKDERMLMVEEDSQDDNERVLKMHPNHVMM